MNRNQKINEEERLAVLAGQKMVAGAANDSSYGWFVREENLQRNFYVEPSMEISILVGRKWKPVKIVEKEFGRGFELFLDNEKVEEGLTARITKGAII